MATPRVCSCAADTKCRPVASRSHAHDTSEPVTLSIEVLCPRACELSADMVYEEGTCDKKTLQREMSFGWFNFSTFDGNTSNVTECDLPRAPTLPNSVSIDCDAIDLDSSWAVNVIVAGAILATAKVALLAYALKHREDMIYRKAQARTHPHVNIPISVTVCAPIARLESTLICFLTQVSFLSLTIAGGIMADFAPVFLLGPVAMWRCHWFASWLLIATTMLCVAILYISQSLSLPDFRSVSTQLSKLSSSLPIYQARLSTHHLLSSINMCLTSCAKVRPARVQVVPRVEGSGQPEPQKRQGAPSQDTRETVPICLARDCHRGGL